MYLDKVAPKTQNTLAQLGRSRRLCDSSEWVVMTPSPHILSKFSGFALSFDSRDWPNG